VMNKETRSNSSNKEEFKNKASTISNFSKKSKGSNFAEVALLTLDDYARMKKNAVVKTKDEVKNQKKINEEQKENMAAAAKMKKQKILDIDKTKSNHNKLSDIDLENIEKNKEIMQRAQEKIDLGNDLVKNMNKYVLYSKVAIIREKQLHQKKDIVDEGKKLVEKLDIISEIERLKDLQRNEEKEEWRHEQRIHGKMIIVDQMKEREMDRVRAKEKVKKEKVELLHNIHVLEEEDKRKAELKKIQDEVTMKEMIDANRRAIENKESKKREARELQEKIDQYRMVKALKEEEELSGKKKIQAEKEMETKKLRDKQEKTNDMNSEFDALRARRAYEENERISRQREITEYEVRKKKVDDLLEFNSRQKLDKELKLAEQAKLNQEEYNRIIEKQLKNLENDKKKEEDKKKTLLDHNQELRRQIKEREEVERLKRREILEDGRMLKQKLQGEKERVENMKEKKISEIKDMNVAEKYYVDLEKFKVV